MIFLNIINALSCTTEEIFIKQYTFILDNPNYHEKIKCIPLIGERPGTTHHFYSIYITYAMEHIMWWEIDHLYISKFLFNFADIPPQGGGQGNHPDHQRMVGKT